MEKKGVTDNFAEKKCSTIAEFSHTGLFSAVEHWPVFFLAGLRFVS